MRILALARAVALLLTLAVSFQAANAQGLKFNSKDVRENLVGTKWKHDFYASRLPGRVTVERNQDRVRTGNSSIRMRLQSGDCGWTVHRDGAAWHDCAWGNERIEMQPAKAVSGKQFYALSIMLGSDFSKLQGQPSYMHSDINLFQWYQLDSGACFNLQYNTRKKSLNIDIRCPNAVYDHQGAKQNRVEIGGPVFDRWHEFVVYADWRADAKGVFRVLHDGKIVMNYQGPTIAKRGRSQVNEAAFIYRYGSKDEPAWRFYRTPSTLWFDDIIRSRRINAIEQRYNFERSSLGFK